MVKEKGIKGQDDYNKPLYDRKERGGHPGEVPFLRGRDRGRDRHRGYRLFGPDEGNRLQVHRPDLRLRVEGRFRRGQKRILFQSHEAILHVAGRGRRHSGGRAEEAAVSQGGNDAAGGRGDGALCHGVRRGGKTGLFLLQGKDPQKRREILLAGARARGHRAGRNCFLRGRLHLS